MSSHLTDGLLSTISFSMSSTSLESTPGTDTDLGVVGREFRAAAPLGAADCGLRVTFLSGCDDGTDCVRATAGLDTTGAGGSGLCNTQLGLECLLEKQENPEKINANQITRIMPVNPNLGHMY